MTTVKNLAAIPAKTNGATVASIPAKTEQIKPVLLSEPKADNFPPLEDRLHRLNQLFDLQAKYNRLQNSLQKLNDFTIKKDGDQCNIRITDDSRHDFSTGNPEIIAEVTAFLKQRIKEKIKSLEPLLKW